MILQQNKNFTMPAFQPDASNPLRRIVALRCIEVLTQTIVLLLAIVWLKIPLQMMPMVGLIALLAAINCATLWRLTHNAPVTDNELFGQLTVDVGILAALLYFAGGSSNPFVSLFLLSPTIAATLLPARHAWSLAGITLAAYTLLMFWNLPLPPPQGNLAQLDALIARATGNATEHVEHLSGHLSGFALHILGMWLNFVISVGIVAFFLTRMAAALKQRERELAAAREMALRHEQILSLGTLAAGAAHQLGTPLGTMAVVIRELELRHADNDELKDDLRLLREQVKQCKLTISEILASAGQARGEDLQSMALDAYLNRLLEAWQIIRPRAPLSIELAGPQPAPLITTDRTLEQAILNLLDNAADTHDTHAASKELLYFTARWDQTICQIEILDCGTGFSPESAQWIGQPFYSTKRGEDRGAGGLGIGLFLTNATVERFGGKVELFNRTDLKSGACTRVTLPLNCLQDLPP